MAIRSIQISCLDHLLQLRAKMVQGGLPLGVPDAALYYYVKEGGFLSKREEHIHMFLFQGLNTNPQNLSIFMRNEAALEPKGAKEKLTKGIFVVYDIFSGADCVIEINIPGNLRIFKQLAAKRELISNDEIDTMYISSILRTLYQRNLPWGRYYNLFHDSNYCLQEFKIFLRTFLKVILKRDIQVGADYEPTCAVKGSHACNLVLQFIKNKSLSSPSIEIIQDAMSNSEEIRDSPKINILLCEISCLEGLFSKALSLVDRILLKYPEDPYLLYYSAKYLKELNLTERALLLLHGIMQFNQFQVWILLSKIHTELRHFSDALVCLNHACRLCKCKSSKSTEAIYKQFQGLGKIRPLSCQDPIEWFPRVHIVSQNPLSIPVKDVEEKYRSFIQKGYWQCNPFEKVIYEAVQTIKHRLETTKFHQLLKMTFEQDSYKEDPVVIKKGMTESMFVNQGNRADEMDKIEQMELPRFLQDDNSQFDNTMAPKASRNLSVIVEIESIVENSNYEEREKQKCRKVVKRKRDAHETMLKLVGMVGQEGELERERDPGKKLFVFNKLRSMSKGNNYFAEQMFTLMMGSSSHRSVLVLIAESLDGLEQRGMRKIQKLPYWMENYIFVIIREKGLKFLNDTLEALNFYDEAIIDTIANAKMWAIKGITY